MAIISKGKIDRNLIPIIIGSIFCFLSRLLFKVETQLFKQKIFPNFLASVCRIFTLAPFLKNKIASRKKKSKTFAKSINTNINAIIIHSDKADKIIGGKMALIILSSVLIFIQGILLLYTYQIKANSWIFDILITTFFYYLIFKIKLYKHHYVSMITITLFF